MAERNFTTITEFALLGFTDNQNIEFVLFIVFFLIYLLILVGNTGMLTLIRIDSRLHTPMYFFLSNLSILDIGYSSVIAPRTLITFVTESKTISFTGCALQFFFFCIAVSCECCLLGVMAYNRFIAVCNPLLYTAIMSRKFCNLLVIASYLTGCVNAAVQTSIIFNLSFCRSNIINHFFCDVPPILKLSCSDTGVIDIIHFIFSTTIVSVTILTILISYTYILVAILRINSAEGRRKAFSTCASHLTAVTIFYGTGTFMYLQPSSKYSMEQDKIISVFYTLAIPMLNPLIYCLRNKEVKEAFKRLVEKRQIRDDMIEVIDMIDLPASQDASSELHTGKSSLSGNALMMLDTLLDLEKVQNECGEMCTKLKGNFTTTEFILLGFTDNQSMQFVLFTVFSLLYLLILVGNIGMVTLIWIDSRLHTPMYFFLSNLSVLDIGYSSVIAPRTLMTFVEESKKISFTGCALQFFFFCIAVSCECCLLGAMAYDRFIAICNPLLYTAIMSRKLCNMLVAVSYLTGCVNAVVQTSLIFNLSFCRSNIINHFFCDVPPILKLSCSDTGVTDIIHFTFSTAIVSITILAILVSYSYILVAILRINSAEGRRKAFSTCASHLTAVIIFYGTVAFMYLRPSSKYSMEQDKIISVFYTLAIPMLNPLIYCLRNKEVKEAFKRLLGGKIVCQRQ
ncbi:uncharacterized protein LOC133377935 [Rhineura floridana]|uniref:uncharacterized protein LOC133377935 n=1 Tax=Rhineura floridana TaxID=261503 RepID=UPI002AC847AE|nr:uncharacterized protein LOC133377935 [Rhineura floridana]